ncbi:Heat shock protein ssb1 [Homalodisca vitripennis]|nr:Heat shock protein ssb1 [Homalodisca vitripennis]
MNGLLRLAGLRYDDYVRELCRYWPFTVVDIDGWPHMECMYKKKKYHISPEKLLYEILRYFRHYAIEVSGEEDPYFVITVPGSCTYNQRRVVKRAANSAGLKSSLLINDTTALMIERWAGLKRGVLALLPKNSLLEAMKNNDACFLTPPQRYSRISCSKHLQFYSPQAGNVEKLAVPLATVLVAVILVLCVDEENIISIFRWKHDLFLEQVRHTRMYFGNFTLDSNCNANAVEFGIQVMGTRGWSGCCELGENSYIPIAGICLYDPYDNVFGKTLLGWNITRLSKGTLTKIIVRGNDAVQRPFATELPSFNDFTRDTSDSKSLTKCLRTSHSRGDLGYSKRPARVLKEAGIRGEWFVNTHLSSSTHDEGMAE